MKVEQRLALALDSAEASGLFSAAASEASALPRIVATSSMILGDFSRSVVALFGTEGVGKMVLTDELRTRLSGRADAGDQWTCGAEGAKAHIHAIGKTVFVDLVQYVNEPSAQAYKELVV